MPRRSSGVNCSIHATKRAQEHPPFPFGDYYTSIRHVSTKKICDCQHMYCCCICRKALTETTVPPESSHTPSRPINAAARNPIPQIPGPYPRRSDAAATQNSPNATCTSQLDRVFLTHHQMLTHQTPIACRHEGQTGYKHRQRLERA